MKKPKSKDKVGRAKGGAGKQKTNLQGALFGGKRPGGRDSVKKRESRLEGKPL